MDRLAQAYEGTGEINAERRLRLDEPIPFSGPRRVRVIILFPDDDIDEVAWLRGAAANPALGFLSNLAEDIYSLDDGVPFP